MLRAQYDLEAAGRPGARQPREQYSLPDQQPGNRRQEREAEPGVVGYARR